MDNGNLSPADITALAGNGGFGNGWEGMIWLFAILALYKGEPPADVLAVHNYIRRKQIECETHIKAKQSLYK